MLIVYLSLNYSPTIIETVPMAGKMSDLLLFQESIFAGNFVFRLDWSPQASQ